MILKTITTGRLAAAGVAVISADHRLLPPSTGIDVVKDVKDVFKFVANDLNPLLQARSMSGNNSLAASFQVDPSKLLVAGGSSGGLCAYLAAVHASPKPKAVLAFYAMGGDLLVRIWPTRVWWDLYRRRGCLVRGGTGRLWVSCTMSRVWCGGGVWGDDGVCISLLGVCLGWRGMCG